MLGRYRHRANARLAGVLALCLYLLALSGCVTTPRLDPVTEQALPATALLDTVPFHGQRDYQCGPASLAMVLNASEVPVTVDALIPQVFLPGRDGSVQPEMLATVRRQGRVPYRLEGRLDALLTEIAAGHPVVVMQNLSLPAWPVWHYAVAIGYDLPSETLVLHSGLTPEQRTGFARFDATWARSDRWAFVALAPGELPAGSRPEPAIRAIAAFERVQGADTALPAWQALVERHPRAAMAWFALGNARHATSDTAEARDAFREAVTVDPDLAVAWLNLGLLLKDQGAFDASREALAQAASRPGRWQARAREALAEVP
ncbi:PA2778 family cysteine peptidase [Halomonas cerina]|uniref:Peptidase C39-like domain-containing protein n=1 Tax=Halomonas cerina TaxID=447424 RepID=A0A839V7Z2_9GAMM|nr:PA2778 family cysteine peptidase [Halomonas cerina]MBB3188814.1 hypothetical protein [Halomonas cerina]